MRERKDNQSGIQGLKFRFFAFISYSSLDIEWGKRIQRKLEHYRMPATLCSEHGWSRTPINPVFFAPTDIQPGGLTEELQERLKSSKHLIVICSPNSAKSEWVGKEIAFFHHLGRTKQIHFFIVDGVPHSKDPQLECFNPAIDKLGLPEFLAANIHERVYKWQYLNKERALVQLVSKLLGIEFDTIWRRHKRMLVQKIVAIVIGFLTIALVLYGTWKYNQPINVEVALNEASVHNDSLPPLKNAIISMLLANENKQAVLPSLGEKALFLNIPHRYLNTNVHVTVSCKDFDTLDTVVCLKKQVILDIYRSLSVYGWVHFTLWQPNSGKPVPNVCVRIADFETISDDKGCIDLTIPLEKQRIAYSIDASMPLETRMVYMPCGEDDYVIVAK